MPELRYDIKLGADTSGAAKAQAAITGVGTAAEKAATTTSERAAGISQAWSGLQQVAQGGAQSVMGLGRAIGGVFQAIGATPIGKWIALVGGAVTILAKLWEMLGNLKGGAQEAKQPVDALATAQDAAKRSAEALSKAYSEGLTSALKSIATDAADAIAWYKQLAAAHEEVAKSVDNQTKAEIELARSQGKITDAQAATRKAGVDAAAEARQAKSRIEAIRIERDEMQKATERAASVAAPLEKAYNAELETLGGLTQRRKAAADALREMDAARRDVMSHENSAGMPLGLTGAGAGLATSETLAAWRADLARYQQASATYASAAQAAPSEEKDPLLGDKTIVDYQTEQVKVALDRWKSASATVTELGKKTGELAATLDLRTKTEQEVLQHNQSARKAENAPAISAAQKAKNEAAQQKAAEVAAYRAAQLSPQQWAGRIAGGMVDDTQMEALRKTYPGFKFPSAPSSTPSTQSTSSTPADPAKRVYGPGEALPVDTGTHVFRGGRLPTDGQPTIPGLGAGNQVTRGPLAPGSDTKQGAVVDALKGTTKATESAPKGEAEAQAAKDLQAKTEEHAAAAKAASDATVAALNQCVGAAEQLVGVQQQQAATVASQGNRIAALEGAIRSLRAKSARA